MAHGPTGRVALLSIHPHFAHAILIGDKAVELRRVSVSHDTSHVLVYATSPVRAVIGWFAVDGIDEQSPTAIWQKHRHACGVTRREFRSYFRGAARAYALRVGERRVFDVGVPLDAIPGVRRPPQSFQYLDWSSVAWMFAGVCAQPTPWQPADMRSAASDGERHARTQAAPQLLDTCT
jgi:predicted transcriptional regulator